MNDLPLLETARALRARELTSQAIQRQNEAAWQTLEPSLSAYKTWNGDGTKETAILADQLFDRGVDLGPLQGIPIAVKDLYGVRNLPTFAGSPRRLPEIWEREGPLVAKLQHDQALITGKTHTVEFAFGVIGTNSHWQTPRNPWDATTFRGPGGSSSGSGVSLWQGTARIALGTDTAASVRAPASFTGTVALKTTKGRWSTDGIVPLSTTFDTPGPLALTADDLSYAFAAIDSEIDDVVDFVTRARKTAVSSLKIGVCNELFNDCDPGIADAVHSALRELEKAGAKLTAYKLPNLSDVLNFSRGGGITPVELAAFLSAELPAWQETLGQDIKERVSTGNNVSGIEYLNRLRSLKDLRRNAVGAFDDVDFIAFPTVAISPPIIDDAIAPSVYNELTRKALRNLSLVNVLGWCAVSMPAGLDAQRLPVGLQFAGPGMSDAKLVSTLVAAERILGTPRQRLGIPPMVI
ncbi:MAG: 2-amino-5-chloromuconate deaminase [Rhodospirillales bacterium]|nr:2-amino-5-chloromuconate deaminase [Rhodospirillales bacterium]